MKSVHVYLKDIKVEPERLCVKWFAGDTVVVALWCLLSS